MQKVEICGIDTSRLKTLSEAEKRELLAKVREGDMEAREKANANLNLTRLKPMKIRAIFRKFACKVHTWLRSFSKNIIRFS